MMFVNPPLLFIGWAVFLIHIRRNLSEKQEKAIHRGWHGQQLLNVDSVKDSPVCNLLIVTKIDTRMPQYQI
jgi:hypothetical protein